MFLEIADIIHLILHQHQQTLNSNKNKKYEPYLLVCLEIPCQGVSSLYIHCLKIARREKTCLKQCIRNRLLPFIKMKKFYFGLTSHYRIMPLRCCTIWKQITRHSFVEIKILPMYPNTVPSRKL